ncbi:MAG TPA: hypothetical protein VEA59_02470 [Patescibacteria group bacterium]|nr:hypothetical protein [Patescibacteria group bacterium]
MQKQRIILRRIALTLLVWSLIPSVSLAQMRSTNYTVSGAALTGPSGTYGAPYGGGSLPGQSGASAISASYGLNTTVTYPAITHDLSAVWSGGGLQSLGGGGGYVPDRLSVQAPLGLAGNESGVLRYDLKDGKIVQLDLQKYSFGSNVKVSVVENKLLYGSRPLSGTPVTLIGNTSFKVSFKDSNGTDVDPAKDFQLTVLQAPGKPMPTNAGVYYFNEAIKVWVKVDGSLVKNNYITFMARKGMEYGVFAGSTSTTPLLATDQKTILDVNKDGKVDTKDRDVIVPEYQQVTTTQNQPIPRAFAPGIIKGVSSEKEVQEGIEKNWKEVADAQAKAAPQTKDGAEISPAYEQPQELQAQQERLAQAQAAEQSQIEQDRKLYPLGTTEELEPNDSSWVLQALIGLSILLVLCLVMVVIKSKPKKR